jgi:hypothetical protein
LELLKFLNSTEDAEMNVNGDQNGFGLLAYGSSRCWEVSIDESLNHEEEWITQIEGPNVYLTFQLNDIQVVSEVMNFLSQPPHQSSANPHQHSQPSIVFGKFGETPVSLLWDDEDMERCFLVASGNGQCVRITLLQEDINMLKEAFSQVLADLA